MIDYQRSKSRPKVIIRGGDFAGLNAAKTLGSAHVDIRQCRDLKKPRRPDNLQNPDRSSLLPERGRRKDIADSLLLWPSPNVVNVNAKEVISMNLSDPVDTVAMSIPCSLTLLDDGLLVARAKDGDTSAFVELIERHSTKVLRTVFRITRNWEDAEDALQESLLRAFRHLNGFENRCSFSSWLTRIAINSALMTLRKRRACKEISIDIAGDDCEIFGRLEPEDLSKDPESRYARGEREELLNGAILQLKPSLRDVIQLTHMDEYSMHELAECLGISLPAAKSRLLRARRALRTILQ